MRLLYGRARQYALSADVYNLCLMTTAETVYFCRHVVCLGLLSGYILIEEWKLGDFGLFFGRDWCYDAEKCGNPQLFSTKRGWLL